MRRRGGRGRAARGDGCGHVPLLGRRDVHHRGRGDLPPLHAQHGACSLSPRVAQQRRQRRARQGGARAAAATGCALRDAVALHAARAEHARGHSAPHALLAAHGGALAGRCTRVPAVPQPVGQHQEPAEPGRGDGGGGGVLCAGAQRGGAQDDAAPGARRHQGGQLPLLERPGGAPRDERLRAPRAGERRGPQGGGHQLRRLARRSGDRA
mmetsp:Transcript_9741/g.28568  ORF Transcript_9741/g.28568 Transcript_9741/m.28568 type:complete len:210 (-) Transcript_9741:71-700(-)